ncbi:MAG TPA: hypothetical protein ENN17_03795 [bacterium]|nr:hypothetical protein [bacterium]
MQGTELAVWIDIAMKIGILIVAILALIKWFGYIDLKKKELHLLHGGSPVSRKNEPAVGGSRPATRKVFDQVLRKEDVITSGDEEEDIPEEEFFRALNQKK